MEERTVLIVKPDGMINVSEICKIIFRNFGSDEVSFIRDGIISKSEAEELYSEHKGKKFFSSIVNHISSGQVRIIVLEGFSVVSRGREVVTEVRNLYKHPTILHRNCIHGSDSIESGEREILLLNIEY